MDLTTHYLGLKLSNPFVPSASVLSHEIAGIKQMEDAGASAVVLYSLFEEQIMREGYDMEYHLSHGTHSFAEALTFFPDAQFQVGPEEYLEHIRKAKKAVQIPVIASLNGATWGGWIEYAKYIEQAGADALELNLYSIPTDMEKNSLQVEEEYLHLVWAIREAVNIPIAIKLGPFFTNMANMAKKLDSTGVNGLVLFNRFYQPDIDLEKMEVIPKVLLTTPHEMRLPLRWIAILSGHIKASLAATTGIYTASDALKMLMAGANVTMLCSCLLKNGIPYINTIKEEMIHWMEENEYESVQQMIGSMSQKNCANPEAFERAQYIKSLTTFPKQQTYWDRW